MDTQYRVEAIGYGLDYCGTDEAAADAAYDRWVAYIDSDTCREPMRVEYRQDGRLVTSYQSITWAAYEAHAGNGAMGCV